MVSPLVECVPNFSEGRDAAKIDAIADAIAAGGGTVLHRTLDPDHNRAVITFIGHPDRIAEAALRGVGRAAELIDLRDHRGVHPRIGGADVVPFVPLAGVTMDDCVRIAESAGERIATELGIPVYLYDRAARRPENRSLADIRRGEFEALRDLAVTDPLRRPDFGETLHPTAGASAVGARKILIAFNVNLDSADLTAARTIARKVRATSGGLPHVKAMGVLLRSRNIAQVSMNLTDFEVTPLHVAYDAVRAEAARLGVAILESEIIGLAPREAVESAAAHYLRTPRIPTIEGQIERVPQ
ncbi:MAG TPA: glutamate formimidoyltransferase [Candidatus Limnocylindrales bacterium]|nr:glutamate formimidoyltransferase [Candidatus Limnocylindrales bacterium]